MYSHIKNKVIRNTSASVAGFFSWISSIRFVGRMFRVFNEFGHLVQLHVHEVPQFRLGKTFKAFENLPWWCPERLSLSDPFQSCAFSWVLWGEFHQNFRYAEYLLAFQIRIRITDLYKLGAWRIRLCTFVSHIIPWAVQNILQYQKKWDTYLQH